MPCGTGQALPDGHILPVQPCTDAGDERRVEEYHHKVADHVIQEEDPVKEEPGRVQEASGNKEREDEREDDKDRDDSRKDREYEEFFVVHENIPARLHQLETSANAFKHTDSVDSKTR